MKQPEQTAPELVKNCCCGFGMISGEVCAKAEDANAKIAIRMDRRKFLSLLGMGVAAAAAEQVIPLGRVWSFPKNIVIAKPPLSQFDYSANYNRAVAQYQ